MGINEKQLEFLSSLKCVRYASDGVHRYLAQGIKCRSNNGIVDFLRSDRSWNDDKEGTAAHYIVKTQGDEILMFFSIRCGELFLNADFDLMQFAEDTYRTLQTIATKEQVTQEEQDEAALLWNEAKRRGLTLDDLETLAQKKQDYKDDVNNEENGEINRVYRVYPAAELVLLGVNVNAKDVWRNANMPRRMGETLFWMFVIPRLQEMLKHVGCQYLYLFAADQESEGDLVGYYRTNLHFDIPTLLGANKPRFDYQCQFMCQEIRELITYKDYFFEHFNSVNVDRE